MDIRKMVTLWLEYNGEKITEKRIQVNILKFTGLEENLEKMLKDRKLI